MNRDELEALVNRHLEGRSTEAEVAALSLELEFSEESRECYLRLAQLHAALASEETAGTTERVPGPPGRQPAAWWRQPLAFAASFMALALLITLAWPWLRTAASRDERPVCARFGALQDVRWVAPATNIARGDPLREGERVELSAGSVGVVFTSGAEVTLLGPCIFEVTSANSGFLTLGQLKALAATPAAKGFTVRTRTARVVDVGTEFVAAAAPDGQSRVDVTAGEVHVHLTGVRTPHRLRTGEALAVEAGQAQVVVRIEPGDGTAAFRFPTIEPPSDQDYADRSRGRARIQIVQGGLFLTAPIPSGPPELLLDGRGQTAPDSPAESVFFDKNAEGALLLDLGQPIMITKINTYSWHQNRAVENRVRAVQRFTLYGFAGEVAPPVGEAPAETGWVPLTRVNSDDFFRVMQPIDRPAQQACSITGAHGLVGRYRYLLWAVQPTHSVTQPVFDNTFYTEFDVYGEP